MFLVKVNHEREEGWKEEKEIWHQHQRVANENQIPVFLEQKG